MIKVLYVYKKNDFLNSFIDRQIQEAALEDIQFNSWSIDLNPSLVEHHEICHHHTIIFKNKNDKEVYRISGPFSASQLRAAYELAKKISA